MRYTFILLTLLSTATAIADPPGPSRTFRFAYASTITGLAPGQTAQVWIPVATNSPEQQVQLLPPHLPAAWQINEDAKYHNRLIFFEAVADDAGTISLKLDYQVLRLSTGAQSPPADPAAESAIYLQPDSHVPVGGKSLQLLSGKMLPADPVQLARVLFDTVDEDLQYRKDKPGWGHGDSDWVCTSRFGNCTDFHSLFISMARGEHLPAKFQIGFAVPPQHGSGPVAGYHCWAWYLPPGSGWTPVDISEANLDPGRRDFLFGHLDADRVAFTTGRDLVLVPPQSGPPLNFFVYPYAEVDGKPVPPEQIKHTFAYTDD